MKIKIVIITLLMVGAGFILYKKDLRHSRVSMLSISSDGQYVISAHHGNQLILWDIVHKKQTIVSKSASEFSASFIKNRHQFLWQNKNTKVVYIYDTNLKEIKSFAPGFEVFGHLYSPKQKAYLAADKDLNIFEYMRGNRYTLKKGFNDYLGYGKLLSLDLVNDTIVSSMACDLKGEDLPISDGLAASDKYKGITHNGDYSFMPCVTLYSIKQHAAIKKFSGLSAKTTATLSPNGHYLVAGDEGAIVKRWKLSDDTFFKLDSPQNPAWLHSCYDNDNCRKIVRQNLKTKAKMPNDFYDHPYANGPATCAVKFIDEQGDFIRFVRAVNYGMLYHVSSPETVTYLNLGKNPQPDTFDIFMSANTIDTAPKANILVMGQAAFGDMPLDKGTGIIVYRFDPKTKKLTRIWAPDGPPPHPVSKNLKQ